MIGNRVKAQALVDTLYERTAEGNLIWSESVDDETFQTSMPRYTIQIGRPWVAKRLAAGGHATDVEPRRVYTVKVLNEMGSVIEEICEDEVDIDVQRGGGILGNKMEEIYEAARRQAFNTEKALDEIIRELRVNA